MAGIEVRGYGEGSFIIAILVLGMRMDQSFRQTTTQGLDISQGNMP
jgi:hypothetical protein